MIPHHWRPLAHERNSIFESKQHTCTLYDPWGPEKADDLNDPFGNEHPQIKSKRIIVQYWYWSERLDLNKRHLIFFFEQLNQKWIPIHVEMPFTCDHYVKVFRMGAQTSLELNKLLLYTQRAQLQKLHTSNRSRTKIV